VCKLKEKVFKFKLNNKLLIYLRIKYKLLKKFPYSRRAMKKEKKRFKWYYMKIKKKLLFKRKVQG